MYECLYLARIVADHGGLEALRRRPIVIPGEARDYLEIRHLGPALHPGRVLIGVAHVSVVIATDDADLRAFADAVADGLPYTPPPREGDGDGRTPVADPEFSFEVRPGDDPDRGWRSGNWRPATFTSPTGLRQAVWLDLAGGPQYDPAQGAELRRLAGRWCRSLRQSFVRQRYRAALRELAERN